MENRFCFAGEQYDPISQQYYLRARFYNPVIGRFTQEDTYRGDGLNLYVYCQNNPVYYVDPSGHSLICAALASKIIDQINARTAGKDEVKKLSAYLREKVSGGKEKGGGGKLSPKEQSMARKLGIDVSDIKLGEYGDMKYDKSAVGQAHHLNQAAAFKNIPYNAGISLKLEGNAFKDIGSPHYNAHRYMEQFWNQYRINGDKYGQTPTVAEYNTALYNSLLYANLDKRDAAFSVRNAFEQQKEYGYNNGSFVRRIPGRIGQKNEVSEKMKINEILYKSLISCNWFQSSGSMDNISFNFDRQIITSKKQLSKNIQSLLWENICLDAQGDLMEYLGTHYTEEFDNYWNKNIIFIKKNYLPSILDNINGAIKDKDFPPELIYSVSHNILMIIISDYYSGYYESVFFKNLLEIYLSGHIPCGWKGKYPEGKIMIY